MIACAHSQRVYEHLRQGSADGVDKYALNRVVMRCGNVCLPSSVFCAIPHARPDAYWDTFCPQMQEHRHWISRRRLRMQRPGLVWQVRAFFRPCSLSANVQFNLDSLWLCCACGRIGCSRVMARAYRAISASIVALACRRRAWCQLRNRRHRIWAGHAFCAPVQRASRRRVQLVHLWLGLGHAQLRGRQPRGWIRDCQLRPGGCVRSGAHHHCSHWCWR